MKKTYLDWSAYRDAGMGDAYADIPKYGGNYGKAIAACINSRQCEQDGKQVMCPSYRVSGNVQLSTGGRVRLLKAALSLPEDQTPLLSGELEQAMQLCVSCKGCKRECEANVDMPLIKSEYLAQRNAVRGISWRNRLFANSPDWLSNFPFLGHAIRIYNGIPFIRKPVAWLLDLNPEVPLPQPVTNKHLTEINASSPKSTTNQISDDSLARVYLWEDTFSRLFDSEIPASARRILQAGGYSLIETTLQSDATPPCCGRTWLAQGQIKEAKERVENLIERFYPIINSGAIIVGLEASCVLGLRDDAKALGLNTEQKEKLDQIASKTLLLEEFLAREIKANRLSLSLKIDSDHENTVWQVHGHCHQKATGAMKSMRRVLKYLPIEFELIDSSCCGMAGTFGLEREHKEYSKKMAEQDLIPAIKAHPDRPLIANGFSCRHQVKSLISAGSSLKGKRPQHLAQVIDSLLD